MACQVSNQIPGVEIGDYGADREAQLDVLRRAPIAISALTFVPVLRAMDPSVAIVDERIDVAVGNCMNASATAAVPAVRSPPRYELLAAETGNAIPPLACVHFDDGFIDETHGEIVILDGTEQK